MQDIIELLDDDYDELKAITYTHRLRLRKVPKTISMDDHLLYYGSISDEFESEEIISKNTN